MNVTWLHMVYLNLWYDETKEYENRSLFYWLFQGSMLTLTKSFKSDKFFLNSVREINTRRINLWMVIALLTRIHWIQILNIYPIWESRNVYHKKNVKMLFIHLFWWCNWIEENRGEIPLPVCTTMHESIYAI